MAKSESDIFTPRTGQVITDYDCSIHGVSNLLGEYENLDKLNYLAARLDEMSRSELEHFLAIIDNGCDEVNDLDDLIMPTLYS